MKITFPHMGNMYIPLKTLFEELHIEVVVPPFNNDQMKNVGCKFAPEYSCLPFKLILGNIVHSLEQGADTVIMLGGSGPCRFGYFGHLLNLIARDMGYSFTFIGLEPASLPQDISRFIKTAGCGPGTFISALALGWTKFEAVDALEREYQLRLPYTHDKDKLRALLHRGMDRIISCRSVSGVKRITGECINIFKGLGTETYDLPIAVLVGDIYTLNEPYSNQEIEELFARCGVETHRSIYTSRWVKNMLLPWKRKAYNRKATILAKDYLKGGIGGFALDTIYHTVSSANRGFDGIVHIFPITCMPEIVSSQILQKVSVGKRIPIMSLTVDEHMEKSGMETRVEAFAELLYNRKSGIK